MNEEIGFLTRDDQQLVRQLLADYKNGRLNPVNRTPIIEQDPTAPEVYVAWVDHYGISALLEGATDPEPGTGTNDLDDRPGQADCSIYWRRQLDDYLVPAGFKQTVYNLSNADVPGNSWVIVVRDKYGSWYIPPPSGVSEFYIKITSLTQVSGRYPCSATLYGPDVQFGISAPTFFIASAWAVVIPSETMILDVWYKASYQGVLPADGKMVFVPCYPRPIGKVTSFVGAIQTADANHNFFGDDSFTYANHEVDLREGVIYAKRGLIPSTAEQSSVVTEEFANTPFEVAYTNTTTSLFGVSLANNNSVHYAGEFRYQDLSGPSYFSTTDISGSGAAVFANGYYGATTYAWLCRNDNIAGYFQYLAGGSVALGTALFAIDAGGNSQFGGYVDVIGGHEYRIGGVLGVSGGDPVGNIFGGGIITSIGSGTAVKQGDAAGGDLTGTYPSPTLPTIGPGLGSYVTGGPVTTLGTPGSITLDNQGRVTGVIQAT